MTSILPRVGPHPLEGRAGVRVLYPDGGVGRDRVRDAPRSPPATSLAVCTGTAALTGSEPGTGSGPTERLFVAPGALEQMHAAIAEHNGESTVMHECGGDLWALAACPDRVACATLTVAESNESSMRLGPVRFPQLHCPAALVGCWHVHPNGRGEPSRADVQEWGHMIDSSGGEWIGVIVAMDRAYGPSLVAYSVTHERVAEIPVFVE